MTDQPEPKFRWLFCGSANRARGSFCGVCDQQAGQRADAWAVFTDRYARICESCLGANPAFHEARDVMRQLENLGAPSQFDHVAVVIGGQYESKVCRPIGPDPCHATPTPRQIEAVEDGTRPKVRCPHHREAALAPALSSLLHALNGSEPPAPLPAPEPAKPPTVREMRDLRREQLRYALYCGFVGGNNAAEKAEAAVRALDDYLAV